MSETEDSSSQKRRARESELLDIYKAAQRSRYDELQEALQSYIALLEAEVKVHLAKNDLEAEVSGRIKSWDTLMPKLEEGESILSIGDLVGVRVILMYEDEVVTAARSLRPLFVGRASRRRWSHTQGRNAGYAGVHVQARPLDGVVNQDLVDLSAELQIRTHLQHVWAELSHNEFYRAKKGVPAAVHDRLFRLAASLDVLSDEIVTIRDQLTHQSKELEARVGDAFSTNWKTVSIDEFTVTVAGNELFAEKLTQLRELAVIAGLRESAWSEPVRVGLETDIFVPCAAAHDIHELQDLVPLIDRGLTRERDLRAVADLIGEERGINHNLFARPLIVLAVVLMLERPSRPCQHMAENILAAIQRVAVGNHRNGSEDV